MLDIILKYIDENIELDKKSEQTKEVISTLSYENNRAVSVDTTTPLKFNAMPYSKEFNDIEVMLYNGLVPIANNIYCGDDMMYSIRSNYGVGTLASFFGAKSSLADEVSLPWCEHLPKEKIPEIIQQGVPSFDNGFGKKLIETYDYYIEKLSKYKNAQAGISLYHPDFQGPFDTAHLLYGSDIYYEFYDEPELVHDLMSLVTDTYIECMKRILPIIGKPLGDGLCYHWQTIYKGNIVLRNDSSVSLSNDMYKEFVMPYDDKIAQEFGGAGMHYCGQHEVWLETMAKEANITALNFGKVPNKTYGIEFLKQVKEYTKERKIPIVNYPVDKEQFNEISQTELMVGTSFIIS